MSTTLEQRCRQLVERLQLGRIDDIVSIRSLTGGVASDIAEVRFSDRTICVKFALPKLKVEADWFAPVHRNAAEYAWLQEAARVCPESAVRLLGHSPELNGFAMDFLEGEDVYLWKSRLLEGIVTPKEAIRVAETLGRIHAASTRPEFEQAPFRNRDDFHALRIEPYLIETARRHPAIDPQLQSLASMLYDSAQVLVHGDASPKNILFRKGRPVLLDAECATMGDASFDPAFCMNHLLLKSIHLPKTHQVRLDEVRTFWQTYKAHIRWETADDVEQRVCHLLPALMLARVDGKSPVDYLDPAAQQVVREIAIPLITSPPSTLDHLIEQIDITMDAMT